MSKEKTDRAERDRTDRVKKARKKLKERVKKARKVQEKAEKKKERVKKARKVQEKAEKTEKERVKKARKVQEKAEKTEKERTESVRQSKRARIFKDFLSDAGSKGCCEPCNYYVRKTNGDPQRCKIGHKDAGPDKEICVDCSDTRYRPKK